MILDDGIGNEQMPMTSRSPLVKEFHTRQIRDGVSIGEKGKESW